MNDLNALMARGRAADAILTDPVFKEAVSATRAEYINAMIKAPDDTTLREAKHNLDVLGDVIVKLEGYLENGKRAAQQLEQLAKQK